VTEKDPDKNTVVLGEAEDLFARRVEIGKSNWLPFERPTGPLRVQAKLRYRQTEQPATLIPAEEGRAILEFDVPQRAPSPGQAAVCYDGDRLIGGGTILGGIRNE
jgi:tRNA-specific 2-thiouridylase